jgi:hypothetical protein
MALLAPKQLAQALAIPGQSLTWDGRQWSPDDALRCAVETQGMLIRRLIQVLADERIDLPADLEEYADI